MTFSPQLQLNPVFLGVWIVNLWMSFLLKQKQGDDLNYTPPHGKNINTFSYSERKNISPFEEMKRFNCFFLFKKKGITELMRRSFGPKSPSDIFADSSNLKPEHLLLHLILSCWLTRCSGGKHGKDSWNSGTRLCSTVCASIDLFRSGGGIKN